MKSNRKILVFIVLISSMLLSSCGSRRGEVASMLLSYKAVSNSYEQNDSECRELMNSIEMFRSLNEAEGTPIYQKAEEIFDLTYSFIDSLEIFKQKLYKELNIDQNSFSADSMSNEIMYETLKTRKLVQKNEFKTFVIDHLCMLYDTMLNHVMYNTSYYGLSSLKYLINDFDEYYSKPNFIETILTIENIKLMTLISLRNSLRYSKELFSVQMRKYRLWYVSPIIIPERSKITMKENYKFSIGLGGYFESFKQEVFVGDSLTYSHDTVFGNYKLFKGDSLIHVNLKPKKKGKQIVKGLLRSKDPAGKYRYWNFHQEYFVEE